tara:strand:+ start:8869 stop:10158 length:1290 start_codon:yes stop_codon:yes gene_type:complete
MTEQVPNKNIENASGQQVRLDIQNALKANSANNFGSRDAAGTILPCEFVADSDTNKLYIRKKDGGDQANQNHTPASERAQFFVVGDLDADNLNLLPKAGGAMTGPIRGDDAVGASTPAFSFDGDNDTGMYRAGVNDIGFSVGGLQAFKIDGNGAHIVGNGSGNSRALIFLDGNNSNYLTFAAPNDVTGNINYTLPGTLVNGGFLKTDASGNLSFQTITTFSGAASALTGNTLASNVTASSLTSVGTLGGLTCSGDIVANGNIVGDGATTMTNMANIVSGGSVNAVNYLCSGAYFGAASGKAPIFTDNSGTHIGQLLKAWVSFNGGAVTAAADRTGVLGFFNVSSVVDNGVGDYSVNFTNTMRNINGNVTDGPCATACSTGNVYPVQGDFAHTNPYLHSFNRNFVRFQFHPEEDSSHKTDQTTVGIMLAA